MRQVQAISVATIALVLVAQFVINEIWPRLYLRMNASELVEHAVVCSRARDSARNAEHLMPAVSPNQQNTVWLTGQVALLDCVEYDRRRAAFIANGVQAEDLRLIELEALGDEKISLQSTVEAYQP